MALDYDFLAHSIVTVQWLWIVKIISTFNDRERKHCQVLILRLLFDYVRTCTAESRCECMCSQCLRVFVFVYVCGLFVFVNVYETFSKTTEIDKSFEGWNLPQSDYKFNKEF